MKARVKGTDDSFKEIETIELKDVCGIYFAKDVEFEPSPDHWQDVRERAAIAAMQGLLVHSGDAHTESFIARNAVIYADALVDKLKGEYEKESSK